MPLAAVVKFGEDPLCANIECVGSKMKCVYSSHDDVGQATLLTAPAARFCTPSDGYHNSSAPRLVSSLLTGLISYHAYCDRLEPTLDTVSSLRDTIAETSLTVEEMPLGVLDERSWHLSLDCYQTAVVQDPVSVSGCCLL
jgi:hypothetical protein